jgi:hypothetical protein
MRRSPILWGVVMNNTNETIAAHNHELVVHGRAYCEYNVARATARKVHKAHGPAEPGPA